MSYHFCLKVSVHGAYHVHEEPDQQVMTSNLLGSSGGCVSSPQRHPSWRARRWFFSGFISVLALILPIVVSVIRRYFKLKYNEIVQFNVETMNHNLVYVVEYPIYGKPNAYV